MGAKKDYTGHRFGNLTALTYHRIKYPRKQSVTFWTCQCACGHIGRYMLGNLTTGKTTKCKTCQYKYFDRTHYKDRGVKITHQGRTQNIREWSKELGIPVHRIRQRRHKRLPIELVLHAGNLLDRSCKRITNNGRTQTIREWADELGITRAALHARLTYYGWTEEQALTQPAKSMALQPNRKQ